MKMNSAAKKKWQLTASDLLLCRVQVGLVDFILALNVIVFANPAKVFSTLYGLIGMRETVSEKAHSH